MVFGIFNIQDQCHGFSAVRVPCDLLDWEDLSPQDMVNQVEIIINQQCDKCDSSGICAQWYAILGQIKELIQNYNTTPAPCDENQCQNYNHSCDENSVCVDLCDGYVCECKNGFETDDKEGVNNYLFFLYKVSMQLF